MAFGYLVQHMGVVDKAAVEVLAVVYGFLGDLVNRERAVSVWGATMISAEGADPGVSDRVTWSAALFAESSRERFCGPDDAVLKVAAARGVEAERPKFFLDLLGDDCGVLNKGAGGVDERVPAIVHSEAPVHAAFFDALVFFAEDLRVARVQLGLQLFVHYSLSKAATLQNA